MTKAYFLKDINDITYKLAIRGGNVRFGKIGHTKIFFSMGLFTLENAESLNTALGKSHDILDLTSVKTFVEKNFIEDDDPFEFLGKVLFGSTNREFTLDKNDRICTGKILAVSHKKIAKFLSEDGKIREANIKHAGKFE